MSQVWTPEQVANRDELIARTAAFSGYSHILLGEAFCSAAIDGGPEVTPAEVFARGEEKFTQAIQAAQSANDAQTLNLAYVGDANGKPVPWNETRWVDTEFSDLLKEANGTLDLEKRRKIFCKLENIQQSRGSIGIAFWINVWNMTSKRVQDIKAHPSLYLMFDKVWLT